MNISKSLISLGLTPNQAKVYIAALQLGVDSVLHIAKAADLKRPTVYLILDDLESKGLVSKTKEGSKTLYKAEKPDRLLTDVKIKEQIATDLLPSLNAIYNVDPDKPNIKIAEGISGVRSVYNGIFTYLSHHPDEELLIYGALKDASALFERQVIDYFQEIMAHSHNPIREIGNDDAETRRYFRKSSKVNPLHELRCIRNDGMFVQTDNMIYGNTLVIFSVKEQISATIIESKNITTTYKTLFNMAWRSGKPI